MTQQRRLTIRYGLVISWLVFTVALATWWYVFTLDQLDLLLQTNAVEFLELKRNETMLRMEGFVLILSLIGGGMMLAYFVFQDTRRSERLREFLLTLSHEVKTPLASLRLQAEQLRDESTDSESRAIADRMLIDQQRLSLQFDNALYLANIESQQLFLEGVRLGDVVRELAPEFDELSINVSEDCELKADTVALRTILRNILRNALMHGKASSLQMRSEPCNERSVRITLEDNGKGFQGNLKLLGKERRRFYRGSGSGIGLFLCNQLAQKMGGVLRFPEQADVQTGFIVQLELPGTVV